MCSLDELLAGSDEIGVQWFSELLDWVRGRGLILHQAINKSTQLRSNTFGRLVGGWRDGEGEADIPTMP